MRGHFQGVFNIVRFNWQFYALSIGLALCILVTRNFFNPVFRFSADIAVILITGSTLVSLLVSWYVYDHSGLYRFHWLDDVKVNKKEKIVIIHAGFDETSGLLKKKFANADLLVFDFYDPTKQTAVSLKRARRAYPPDENSQHVQADRLPLQNNSVDKIFVIFAAHEIRTTDERISFFKELRRILTADGRIIVTEHLRDAANYLAYNIGCFHFHSRLTWQQTFAGSKLSIEREMKITPFITTFFLHQNGTAS